VVLTLVPLVELPFHFVKARSPNGIRLAPLYALT